jgi:hypothetical protein
MLRHVALVRTDVSEELSVSFIRVTRIGELGTTLAVTSNRRTLRRNTTRRNIQEDTILHSHRRENLKSYMEIEIFSLVVGHQTDQSISSHCILCFRSTGTIYIKRDKRIIFSHNTVRSGEL